MNFMQRFRGHLGNIINHKYNVFKLCAGAGIFWQGITHDMSKLSPAEFWPGVRYFEGDHSPNEGEREDLGYSLAWMHHKGRNRHHYEYWCDYSPETKLMTPVMMPKKYLAEMFCDRVAANKTYKKKDYKTSDPLAYFERANNYRREHGQSTGMHPDTEKQLGYFLTMLRDEGEKKTLKELKKWIRQ